MPSAPFEYVRASSWEDAVRLLADGGEDARVIAGGQSLVPMMMLRLAEPEVLVDVGPAAPRTIEHRDGVLRIGALARHVDVQESPVVRAHCPVLADAAGHIGNVRVRHRGTFGGALAHAEPTAEWPCLAVALGATIGVLGPGGPREVPAGDFFVSHFTTALEDGEVVTHVDVPLPGPGVGAAFAELARRAGDFALAEVAAVVGLDGDGRCAEARLVVGATSERPVDLSAALAGLRGEPAGDRWAAEAARAAAADAPIGSHPHASEDYRREMVAVLARRALLAAAARAGTGDHEDGDRR
jgi:carbon-monoxide dehydrogenase medium subunit